MNTICHWLDFFRQRNNGSHLYISAVFICNLALHINIAITDQIEFNRICCGFVDKSRCFVHLNIFAGKVFAGSCGRSVIKNRFNIALKISDKTFIAFACDNRQYIDIVNTVSAAFHIHTIAVLIYAKSQTTPNFLAFCCLTVRMLQRTNLKNIRIIPTFTKCRVGEDKASRFFKGKQPLFILQNQIISRNIIRELTATLQLTINTVTGLFINTEISFVYSRNIAASGF